MTRMQYKLLVTFPFTRLYQSHRDRVEQAVGEPVGSSGAGCGFYDMDFYFDGDSGRRDAALARLVTDPTLVQDLHLQFWADEYDEDELTASCGGDGGSNDQV